MQNNTNNKYKFNNWLKEDTDNTALKIINAKGAALAMNQSGALVYRLCEDEAFETSKDYKAISQVFSNLIGSEISLINKPKQKKDEDDDTLFVPAQDLKLLVDERFEPHTNEEFIEDENGFYYLNKYKPSYYMQLECNLDNFNPNSCQAIFALIEHLSNYDNQRANWIINWLAYFFQGLKKAQTALILRGEQGAGKGIFFEEVIKPLVGEAYTKTINDKSLNTQYLGGLVEDVLFFNLDEISVKKAQNESIKNFLKALVTNPTITAEKKYKTLKKETKIYGQVLIASNEEETVEIEPSDRRYTKYNTAGDLKYTKYLGYGSYEALSEAIKSELEAFMCYLKNYRVDEQSANTAQMTAEKEHSINIYMQKQHQKNLKHQPKLTKLQKSIQEYAYAIIFKDFNYFESIRFDAPELYSSVMNDLYNDLFRISNLLPVYKIVYGNSLFKTTSELLRELQNYDWYRFGTNKFVSVMIDESQEECLDIRRFPRRY